MMISLGSFWRLIRNRFTSEKTRDVAFAESEADGNWGRGRHSELFSLANWVVPWWVLVWCDCCCCCCALVVVHFCLFVFFSSCPLLVCRGEIAGWRIERTREEGWSNNCNERHFLPLKHSSVPVSCKNPGLLQFLWLGTHKFHSNEPTTAQSGLLTLDGVWSSME